MAGAFAGCGSEAIKPNELVDFKPARQAQVVWRASLGEAKAYVFTPALNEGALFAASAAGDIARLDPATGKQIWRTGSKERLSGGVGADLDLVLVGTSKGQVIAYGQDGKERWRAPVSSEVLGAPRAAGGVVVARTVDGRLFGLDAATGKRSWEHQTNLPPLILRTQASVMFTGKLVLAGLAGGRLLALDLASGVPVWETVVAQPKGDNELERISDVASVPIQAADDQVCVVAYQGRVACVELAKGTLVWGREASSAGRLARAGTALYLTQPDGVVLALDKDSGATLWKQDKLLNRSVTGPAALGDVVVVGDYQGQIHVLDAQTGDFLARTSTDGSAVGSEPLVAGENVIVQTRQGGVFAIVVK